MVSTMPSLPREAVIDTSTIAAWTFEEQHTEAAQKVMRLVYGGRVKGFVPELFLAEYQNVCRKKRADTAAPITDSDMEASYRLAPLHLLLEVPVLVDLREQAWRWIRRLGLGSYDAYFLALGEKLGLEVWTVDERFVSRTRPDPLAAGLVRFVPTDPRL